MKAHQAWRSAPASIEISGVSTRGTVTEPIRITATQHEEALLEYGDRKRVATPAAHFRDDGVRVTPESTPAGFTQLDAAGIFFLVHLANRPVQSGLPRTVENRGRRFTVTHLSTGRAEIHFSQRRVEDAFDLYVNEAGLLEGISRSFYTDRPDFAFDIQTVFSDYRNSGGVLLPHRIDRYVQNRLVESIAVSQYLVGVPAPPSLFQRRSTR